MQQTPLPLHPAQHDVFTDQLINTQSPHYNLGGYIVLRGELDKPKFIETIHSGAAVFDAFKIRFDANGSRFEGYYDEGYTSMEIGELDFSHLMPEEVIAWMQERFNTAFEINKNKPLFEQYLIKVRENEHWFFGRYHHVITDGYGFTVWVNYIANKYKSLVEGDGVVFAYPSYREAAAASFDYKNSPAYAAEGMYWKEKLPEKPQRLLQKKYADATQLLVKSSTYQLDLNGEQRLLIDNLQESTKVGIQQLTIAALLIYFGKTSGQSGFLFGIPVHKRGSRKLRNIVGMFSGILPHRSTYDPDIILLDLLKDIAASQKRDYRNQNYLIGDLTRTLKIPATEGYLCEVLINYEPLYFNLDFGTAIDASIIRLANEADPNPLQICWRDYAVHHALQLQIHYSTAFFTGEEIEWLAWRILFILQQFSAGLHQPIGSFEILPPEEHRLLSGFNNTYAAYPHNRTIVDLFEEQVGKTPEKTAVVYENQQLSYQDLNVKANRLAHYLQSRGARADMLIPICIERSVEMIVGILGILKAGGAYVPVDPEYPSDRIEYIINDTNATIVVSNKTSSLLLPQSDKFEIVETGLVFTQNNGMPEANLRTRPKPNSLAYVIYTSGSTGRPKGAMNEHDGVVNRLLWAKDYFTVTDEDSILQKTTFSFDVSVWELFLPLLSGARLVFAASNRHKDDSYLREIIEKEQITIIHFIPSMLGNFLPDIQTGACSSLKKVLCSGEVLKTWHVNLFREKFPAVELHNLYGPTEAAIDVTCWTVPDNNDQIKIVPIGKVIANTVIYILNKEKQAVPIGTTGEMYIGGVQVGRGYLNLPDLTKEKFVADPFSKETGARMYKTGDLGRWLTDGNIEYLGRIDNQVKIRGYRIELGEIETVLEQSKLVKQAVVAVKEDGNGNKRLVGYVVADKSFDRKRVTAYLKHKLPEYMVPALWVQLETWPLTPNGKTDRKALPDVDMSEQVSHRYIAPATTAEADVAAVWQQLLNIERIGTADNFFELGGDSIIAIQVTSRLKQLGYFLQPKDLFVHQTIGNLTAVLKEDSGAGVTAEQGLLTGAAGLLPIQQGYFEKDQPVISHYNQSVLLKVEKSITPFVLQHAITELTTHHDALRFTYHQTNGVWQQEYGSGIPEIRNEDLRAVPDHLLRAAISESAGIHHYSLNIEKGEIIRAIWIQTPDAEKNNRLLIIIHHLAVDVVSWRIVLEDLQHILNAIITGGNISPGSKSSSYRQWYTALENYGQSKRLLSQQKYWEEAVKNYSPVPVDNETAKEVRIKDTGLVTLTLNATQTARLLQYVPRAYHTEIVDLLLAALALTLCEWSKKDKLVIGLEGHGREPVSGESIDTSRTVGWFTSLYPVVLEAAGAGMGTGDWIIGIKEQLRQVPDRGIGYGVLKYIKKEPSLQAAETWDIVFNYLGQLDNVARDGTWLSVSDEAAGAAVSDEQVVREKLSVDSYIQTGELVFTWKYSRLHYRAETIKAITGNYLAHLELLISYCVEKAENDPVFTPSDYGLGAEISYPELHAFLEEAYNGRKRKNAIEGIYRLSSLQQGMLFHGLYDGGKEAYMEQFSCDIVGLDPEVFKQSWNYLLRRHTVLRSAFYHEVFGIPVQCVYRDVELTVHITDHRLLNTEEQKVALKAYEDADLKTGFDFKAPPLTRLGLIRLSEDRYRMVWTSHHILFDGWSLALLMEEFLRTYEQAVSGKELHGKKEDRYEDYIRYLERVDYEPAEKYWRTYLQNIEQATLLPFINSTTERIKGIGEYQSVFLKIDAATTIRLQDYVQQHRVTVNTVMQGVWAYLLHSYTGNPDIVFGAIVSGRTNDIPDIENRVGMFINTLPLHAHVSAEASIAGWLQQIQVDQVSSRQYQHLPLQHIQALTRVQGDLFDSLLVFENYPVSKILSSNEWTLQFENIQLRDQNNYPLTVTIGIAEEVVIDFRYNTSLLQAAYIQKIKAHFEHVLVQIIQQQVVHLKDIELLTVQDKHQLVHEFNHTTVATRGNKNIVELFEEQVIKNPGSLALVFEAKEISFSELNERANRLAHYLRSTGVTNNTLVPVCVERGIDMVVAIWGILKAGGAYVPVDPAFPLQRISYILDDCGADIMISSKKSISRVDAVDAIRIIDLDDQTLFINRPAGNPDIKIEPDALAYIMYTSGSTGHPKGVMVQHRNLVHYLCNSKTEYGTADKKGAGSFMHLSYTFDASLTALFMPLLKGKSIVIGSKDATDVFEDANLWKYAPYDFIKLTPAHLELVQPKMELPDGTLLTTTLVVGGEALLLSHVYDLLNKELPVTIINEYGPTEATVGCSTYTFNTAEKNEALQNGIPIGKPIDHTELYIVNEAHDLVAIGVAGEICIGGAGIAKGYVNRPDLTAEKFVTNPFKENSTGTMYKTGDTGRWLPNGNIEFLGRKDNQVKIRGYRIELNEIENVLQQSELVKQAVVLAVGDTNENKRLVAFIVPEGYFEKEEILGYLSSRLPGYMLPSLLKELEALPLTQNGKIDRKALAATEKEDMLTHQFAAARNETEEKLTEIWQQLLEIDQVGINDDFFESGGHSLLAVRMIAAIRKEFGAEPGINDIFDYPTIALMAAKLQSLLRPEGRPVVSGIGIQTRPVRIPLSFSQERLWFIHQLEGSAQYHVPAVFGLYGKLNKEALHQSLQAIINRHEVLRTVIRQADGKGYQFIAEKGGWQLSAVDGGIFEEDKQALQRYINSVIEKPFDLSNDRLIRATLITLNDNEHMLVVTMHHIASDAWSTAILVKEFMELYSAYNENRPAQLPPMPLQYADYAIWQRNYFQEDILNKKLDYWKEKLDNVVPLQLPADYARPAESSTNGASAPFHIPPELQDQLLQVSQQHGATLYMTLLAAFNVLLYRYSGQQDICVGTSTAGRPQQELEGLIGFFVNTLALRNQVKGDMQFGELLAAVRTTMREAYAHQDVPFEKVVEAVVKDRDPGQSPLFQVMLVLRNTPDVPDLALDNLVVSSEPYGFTTVKFDLTFFLTETPQGLEGNVLYSTGLFKRDRIERMIEHFVVLLHSVAATPGTHVGTLKMLSIKEESGLKQGLSISKASSRENNTVVTLFEKQAIRWPRSVAVSFEGTDISYAELNERANRLAHCLRSYGVKEDTLVPLFIDRGPDMITGIIGILKAGGAYVPIDTSLPPERIGFMLQDTAAPVVVCNSGSREKLSAYNTELVETGGTVLNDQPKHNPDIGAVAHNLAYVIYTSGSTGQPKGVMITHSNLTDYLQGLDERTGINSCQSFALVSTIATDLGNTVLFSSLVSGGTLHVFSKEMVSNTEGLHDYFRKHYIDCVKIVPSHWKALIMDGEPLLPRRLLVFGGESLQPEQVAIIRESGRNCRVVNHYGPTETTVGKLLYEVDIHQEYVGTIPIGKPFGDNRIYVLSADLSLCPIGVPGQLYIGGTGVARGYLNNEKLTSEKFIADPFDKASRLIFYKTGDQVNYNAEGEIVFVGRIDDQVKIRGYRVEPGEVERVLSACELVKQAVVLAKDDSQGNKRLIGYIVADGYFDREGILEYVQQKLPDYMIPAVLVPLESMPLTANGKVNRQALPDPDATAQSANQYVAPRNETEQQLADIWESVLEVDQIGVQDNFFELGGHSLLAVRLISAIRKGFNVEVSIGAVFDYPTIAELAAQLSLPSDKATETLPVITVVHPRPVQIPLSFSQERLWFIDKLEGSAQYHVPAVLRLKGVLNVEALSYALSQITNRHEVLRTVIKVDNGKPYQYIRQKDQWELSIVDKSIYNHNSAELQQFVHELLQKPFDLSMDNMMRGHLIVLNQHEQLLAINLHHIVSDGWSRSILVRELVALYESYEKGTVAILPELALQYADYAIWQRTCLEGQSLDDKLRYWKKQLEGIATLQLPTDFRRPAVQTVNGAIRSFTVEPGLSKQIRAFCLEQGTTLYMTLLSVFNVLLYRYSGQEDICVGTGIAGRQQKELEELIGFFVNTLAMRNEVRGNMRFRELLQQVKATTLEAYSHQDVPFEKVVDAVVNERDLSRNALFQVSFIVQNTPDVPELRFGNVALSMENTGHVTSKFDLTFSITENGEVLDGIVEYNSDLYRPDTIERMTGHFKQLIYSALEAPEQEVAKLLMLTQPEEQLLLGEAVTVATAFEHQSLMEKFSEQVAKTPDSVAVIFEHEKLSYTALDCRSNQVASYLMSHGVKPEQLVPVCIERSLHMIVGILGILKAGATYVPIDPGYPAERIAFILEDTGANTVLCTSTGRSKIAAGPGLRMIEIDSDLEAIGKQPEQLQERYISPEQVAYIIYTSGSTGKPKGVMVEHRSVVNLIRAQTAYFTVTADERILQFSNYCFDASVEQIFLALLNGAVLVLYPEGLQYDIKGFENFIKEKAIDHLHATPFFLENISPQNINPLKRVIAGGDKCRKELAEKWKGRCTFYNEYGPTETTVTAIEWRYEPGREINSGTLPIGKPVANVSAYILDKNGMLCAQGIPGELSIGGVQVARGYLNRPELTQERFIPAIFNKEAGEKWYRTGDLARLLPDGNFEFLGRTDDQIKLHGYRIELGEIETVLNALQPIENSCIVVKYQDGDASRLVGYYVPKPAVVKRKEQDLYAQQVNNWKAIHENEYVLAEKEKGQPADPEFNILGWNDSFTREPIGEAQMREWQRDYIDVVLQEKPGNVLEIGCGSGLIYYPLAGKINKYIGTDFSQQSIKQIRNRIGKGERDYGPTELIVCAAHEIALDEREQVDTVLINSVVQYFPGADYLEKVIGKSISLLNGKGRIIIGDVRDYRLLQAFKARLLLQKMQGSVRIKEFNWALEQEILNEEELCFSPAYFYGLRQLYPQITHIGIQWKQGACINELTMYRFTVVIHVGITKPVLHPVWKTWNDENSRKEAIKQLQQKQELVALQGVPNPRLWKERLLQKALNNSDVNTVVDIAEAVEFEDEEATQVAALLNMAAANGYQYNLLLADDPLQINVLFRRNPSDHFIRNAYSEKELSANAATTNIPLFADIGLLLQKDIQQLLLQKLPEYMVPSEWVVLGKLPLTVNGKLDRKFLSERDDKIIFNRLSYAPPSNELEERLVDTWNELLHLESVGIYDNFFELGGHSLMAMRVISAIRTKLNLELAVKDLFLHPTIAQLAVHLQSLRKGLVLPAIEKQSRPEYVPLSFSQERLWFIDSLGGSVQYHLPVIIKLTGRIDIAALQQALRYIIHRHEILKTVVRQNNGHAYQYLLDENMWDIEIIDGTAYNNDHEQLELFIQQKIDQPFVLSKDYMIRTHLINLNADEHILLVTMHHIAADAWSMSIIVHEVAALYTAVVNKKKADLPLLPIQYADYAIWQRTYLQGALLDNKLKYWQERLQGVATLELPTDYSRPVVQSSRGSVTHFSINKKLSTSLKLLSQQQGVTLYMSLLAAFKVLLYKYSGQQDICVGTSVANRTVKEVEGLVGFFINILALRSEVRDGLSFTAFLHQVKDTMMGAYEHQDVPFEKVVDIVVKDRDMSRNPLVQVMFIMINTPEIPDLQLGGVTLSMMEPKHSKTLFDMSFYMKETDDGLQCWVGYSTDLYNEDTIVQMTGNFLELLKNIVANPEQQVGNLSILTPAEQHKILVDFNHTKSVYPAGKSIAAIFEEQVLKTPDAVALVFEDESLTYQQLNERSNQLAHFLRSQNVKTETFVPVAIERSIEMIVGIIGILKAGGVYVPLDTQYPEDRISYMLNDISAEVILTDHTISSFSSRDDLNTIDIVNEWGIISRQSKENLLLATSPSQLAYVMYTSGSTGTPKGVMAEQQNVVSLVKGVDYVSFSDHDILLSTGSSFFDATTFEYWGMLLNGGKLVLCKEYQLLENELLKGKIRTQQVNKIWFTSSWFNQLVDGDISVFEGLETVVVGGEKLSEKHIEKIRQFYPSLHIVNGYGPTENTTFSLTYHIRENKINRSIPIGRPLNNRFAYVLDSQRNVVPVGVTGEIYLAGAGLTRGYLNNNALTDQKFVFNPFSTADHARMYKTGDLGCWLQDGNIQFQGRVDDQIKIRGYRIEPGEIEMALEQHASVKQCVIAASEDHNGKKRLVAYVVPEASFDREILITYLKTKLPEYMVPAIWMELSTLPLTSNGKVNKNALPEPDANAAGSNAYEAPQTALEKALAAIWKDLLEVDKVGIHDNFFELGGDSILAIQLVSRSRKAGYEMMVADVFSYQTISQLAKLIKSGNQKDITGKGEQGKLTGPCGLLPIQQWYFDREHAAISHFNQSILLKIDKTIPASVLKDALEQIVWQHDALRFRFNNKDGHWKQEFGNEVKIFVEEEISQTTSDSFTSAVQIITDRYQKELDIENGNVMKAVLIKTTLAEAANRLFIVIHHLVVDGVSWRILLQELEEMLNTMVNNGKPVTKAKGSSYRQWYEALVDYGKSERLSGQYGYWQKAAAAYQPLPVDKEYNGTVQLKDTAGFTVKLGATYTRNLVQEVPRAYHTEINDILLSALVKTVSEWSNQDHLVIGLEGHGREAIAEAIDLTHTVGWFTSLYPLLLSIGGTSGVGDIIKTVKEQLRKVPDKGLGYGVVKYVNKETFASGKEPWDIQFNYLGQLDNIVKLSKWLAIATETSGEGRSEEQMIHEKLSVTGHILGGELILHWTFSARHYDEKTMKYLADDYIVQLKLLIEHCMNVMKSGAVSTPSDYGLGSDMSYEELDLFIEEEGSDNIMSF